MIFTQCRRVLHDSIYNGDNQPVSMPKYNRILRNVCTVIYMCDNLYKQVLVVWYFEVILLLAIASLHTYHVIFLISASLHGWTFGWRNHLWNIIANGLYSGKCFHLTKPSSTLHITWRTLNTNDSVPINYITKRASQIMCIMKTLCMMDNVFKFYSFLKSSTGTIFKVQIDIG